MNCSMSANDGHRHRIKRVTFREALSANVDISYCARSLRSRHFKDYAASAPGNIGAGLEHPSGSVTPLAYSVTVQTGGSGDAPKKVAAAVALRIDH
jgi:hypothetical protein